MKQAIRTALFVPATRPERFAKALAAGAAAVIIDLEDAVERDYKDQAREHMRRFAETQPEAAFYVRINDATSRWFEDDLAVCEKLSAVAGILLPKAETGEQASRVAATGKAVVPIIESARGVLNLADIAAVQGVERLSFGSLDLMLELGTAPDTAGAALVLDNIRCQILLHSAAYGLAPALDGVYPNFADKDGLATIAGQVRDMGFGGMLCIHPLQVPVIESVFAPAASEKEWAQRVVQIADDTGSSAFQLDGQMVDAPVILRARRLLDAL